MACLKLRKQLTTASQYIMIHLSLFTFNAATQQPSKLQCFYGCPSHVTIEDCFVRSLNKVLHLQLMSIILHRGSSTLSGHYVCLTQRKGLWYACDDEGATLVEAPNQWLLNNDNFTPYMYMFKTTIQDLNDAHPSDEGIQTSLYEKGIHKRKGCQSIHNYTLSALDQMLTRILNRYMIAHSVQLRTCRMCLRRIIVSFARRYRDKNIISLVCSICAQIHSVDFECHGRPPIRWHSPFDSNNGGSFFGMCKEYTERLLGLTTYFNAYGTKDSGIREQVQTKWCLNVPFTDEIIQVLCCPEDRRCVACPRNACGIHNMNCPLCPQCELPICASCSDELS